MTEYYQNPIVGPMGPEGPRGDQGIQGIQGPPGDVGGIGPSGSSFRIIGNVPTRRILDGFNPEPGTAYVINDTGHVWVYSGGDWIDLGQFRGYTGVAGRDGVDGSDGREGPQGERGTPGQELDLTDVILSREDNLINNGNGFLRNTKNFSQFDSAITGDTPQGVTAAFYTAAQNAYLSVDTLIPLAPETTYEFKYWVRHTDNSQPSTISGGMALFDNAANEIHTCHYAFLPNTTTTLKVALRPGDMLVQLNDASNWHNGDDSSLRNLIFWNYPEASGKAWGIGTYSRNVSDENSWDKGAIDFTNNTITLSKPWYLSEVPAGTPVSNNIYGDLYVWAQKSENVSNEWSQFSSALQNVVADGTPSKGRTPIKWGDPLPSATVTVKPVWRVNETNVNSTLALAGVSLSATAALRARMLQADQALSEMQEELTLSETRLEESRQAIEEVRAQSDQAFADAQEASGLASQATLDARDAWNKAVEASKLAVVKIDSSRGVLFRQNEIATILKVTVYKGDKVINNLTDLQSEYGAGAYLEWQWQRLGEDTFGVISSADSKIGNGGFTLTLGPDDVDTKVVFRCTVNGE